VSVLRLGVVIRGPDLNRDGLLMMIYDYEGLLDLNNVNDRNDLKLKSWRICYAAQTRFSCPYLGTEIPMWIFDALYLLPKSGIHESRTFTAQPRHISISSDE